MRAIFWGLKMRNFLLAGLGAAMLSTGANAAVITETFDGFAEGTIVTNQIPGADCLCHGRVWRRHVV